MNDQKIGNKDTVIHWVSGNPKEIIMIYQQTKDSQIHCQDPKEWFMLD